MRDLVEKLFVLAIHGRGGYHQAVQIAPAGDRAVLLDLGDVTAGELRAAGAYVRTLPGVVRVTPGHSSLYVIFDGAWSAEATLPLSYPREFESGGAASALHVPVAFDGPDLAEFLAHARLTREAFLARIPDIRLVARYLGFRGGFAYLDGWPAEWSMPRRPTSRPVAAGSFAIGGSVAAFYPIDSPGGWNLLGRTDLDLENAIEAGDEVRIRAVESSSLQAKVTRRLDDSKTRRPPFELHAPLATWTGTPFDDVAAALANEAAGNDAAAPLLECPMVGPRVRFPHDAVIAWCTPGLTVATERVRAGDERTFGRVTGGLRAYLAVGTAAVRNAAVGTAAVPAAAVAASRRHETAGQTPARQPAGRRSGDRHTIRARNGPHDRGLTRVECEVTPQLDRVGIRLRPLQPLRIDIPADLKSIGMQCGTVQLHPDGSLVAMGPDHPVTGGYLQPLTVLSAERWKLAQLVPGERITFVTA
ncbi:MAG TPA: carboxyltransferase domain-containing protein [Thermoanaerobaculia bacterium]|nr:carboxyltransferase domain-containing protein [Thermoanaerobaculia bacterium]